MPRKKAEPQAQTDFFLQEPEPEETAPETAVFKKQYVYLDVTGIKAQIKAVCEHDKVSMTEYIRGLIETDLKKNAKRVDAAKQKKREALLKQLEELN